METFAGIEEGAEEGTEVFNGRVEFETVVEFDVELVSGS